MRVARCAMYWVKASATVTATPNAVGAEPKSRAIRFYVKTFSIVNGAGSCWRVATN